MVVELQAELLSDLDTVIVVPLVPVRRLPPIAEINPLVEFEGQSVAVRLEQLVSIPRSRLGNVAGSLLKDEYQIMRALDRLLSRT